MEIVASMLETESADDKFELRENISGLFKLNLI